MPQTPTVSAAIVRYGQLRTWVLSYTTFKAEIRPVAALQLVTRTKPRFTAGPIPPPKPRGTLLRNWERRSAISVGSALLVAKAD